MIFTERKNANEAEALSAPTRLHIQPTSSCSVVANSLFVDSSRSDYRSDSLPRLYQVTRHGDTFSAKARSKFLNSTISTVWLTSVALLMLEQLSHPGQVTLQVEAFQAQVWTVPSDII